MFCSNCGFENPAVHRFCGMCGTPLPQKPLTTPEAQSTFSFTRLPVEVSHPASSALPGRAKPAVVPAVVEEAAPIAGAPASATAPAIPQAISAQPAPVTVTQAGAAVSGAESNYFTQAQETESLEQFIASFKYTPPSEEDEVTMTGEKPVLDASTTPPAAVSASLSDEPVQAADIPTAVETTAQEEVPYVESQATQPPPFAIKTAQTQTPDRARFLDFSEPAVPEMPKGDIPPVVEPTFIDLGDSPVPPDDTGDTAPHRSHWSAWTAAIVILILAGLGMLEWRAEHQGRNGPIGVVKAEIQRLKQRMAAAPTPSPDGAAAGSQPEQENKTPERKGFPEQKPQSNTPDTGDKPDGSSSTPANPGTSSADPQPTPQAQARPSDKSSAPQNSQAGTASPTGVEAATNTPGLTTAGETSGKVTPNGKSAPGADELLHAQNASDAAAASAWLWKAVAKGNPEAPIKLANLYIRGDGVPQSCEQALVLLRTAAAKENAAAISRLGSMYATGTCVSRDRVRAYEYMSSAVQANPNAAWARDFRAQLWAHMTPAERTQAEKYR